MPREQIPDDTPAELVPLDDLDAIMAVWEGEVLGYYYADGETWANSEALRAWRKLRALPLKVGTVNIRTDQVINLDAFKEPPTQEELALLLSSRVRVP